MDRHNEHQRQETAGDSQSQLLRLQVGLLGRGRLSLAVQSWQKESQQPLAEQFLGAE
jgi:hypothetical protein